MSMPPDMPPNMPHEAPYDMSKVSYEESKTDNLNLYRSSPNYKRVIDEGAYVVNLNNLNNEKTFFVVYIPQGFETQKTKRVLIAIHGSHGTAYPGIENELEMSKKYGYAIVAIQWWMGQGENYFPPQKVYGFINMALKYMKNKYDIDLSKCAYTGFSRGSAISYEITFLDKFLKKNFFALTISHSGGIPPDMPTQFFRELQKGTFGESPYKDAHFFMYAGLQDEEWGDKQGKFMQYTSKILQKYGATIEELIIDPFGTHGGYHKNKEYHERAIKKFMELTPDDTVNKKTEGQ